ncbi:hypothetical protein [Paracidovorax avenae]|nr:hypothetical protein [Paracidovorax avenae]
MKSIRQVASSAGLVIATCAQSVAMAALFNIPKITICVLLLVIFSLLAWL